jgi:hypothetical protein
MGMDQQVTFAAGSPPSWEAIRGLLGERGFPPRLLMIDGELALPDETPAEAWRELRVGTPQGMVTLRRGDGGVRVVTWGNADAALRQAWNAVTWACAEAGGGQVLMPSGAVSADEFRRTADLPPVLR